MNKTAVADASAATNEGPETSGGQPARASNIDAIVAYFESGITPAGTAGELGIELEHTLVHDDMSPVAYSGPYGVEWLLGQLEAEFPRTTRDPEGDLLGVARPGEAVTIEPAAQVGASRTHARRSSGSSARWTTCWHPTASARSRWATTPPPRRSTWSSSPSGATSS